MLDGTQPLNSTREEDYQDSELIEFSGKLPKFLVALLCGQIEEDLPILRGDSMEAWSTASSIYSKLQISLVPRKPEEPREVLDSCAPEDPEEMDPLDRLRRPSAHKQGLPHTSGRLGPRRAQEASEDLEVVESVSDAKKWTLWRGYGGSQRTDRGYPIPLVV